MEFSEALIQNNKQFEFMAYPDKKKITEFMADKPDLNCIKK